MKFYHILEKLESIIGFKATREGWNGKGAYIYYVKSNKYPANTEVAKTEFGDLVPYSAYIAFKTSDNIVTFWTPSQSDLFADDWIEVK